VAVSLVDWLVVGPRELHPGDNRVVVRLLPERLRPEIEREGSVVFSSNGVTARMRVDFDYYRPVPLELVLAIDTIGDAAALAARVTFARGVCEELLQNLGAFDSLRVAVIGYADHNHQTSLEGQVRVEPVTVIDFAEPRRLERMLGRLHLSEGQDYEAAFEDALDSLFKLSWSASSHRVLVAIADRPPHPRKPEPGLRQLGSPAGLDWRTLVKRSETELRLQRVAVRCPTYWPGAYRLPAHAARYAMAAWREIANAGYFDLTQHRPVDVARRLIRQSN
jgi:hypothetical protein